MHVMFMSAYTGGQMLVLNDGWAFFEKPFVASKLVEKVSSVLDPPEESC